MMCAPTAPRIDPSLKAERIQLPAPPVDLDVELDSPAEAEALVAWLAAAPCAGDGGALVTVEDRRVRIAAAA